MPISYNKIIGECENIIDETGCDPESDFMRMVMSAISHTAGQNSDRSAQPDDAAIPGTRLQAMMEEVNSLYEKRRVLDSFIDSLGDDEISLFIQFSSIFNYQKINHQTISSDNDVMDLAVKLMPLTQKDSALRLLIEAFSAGEDLHIAMKRILAQKNNAEINTQNNRITRFIKRFRLMVKKLAAVKPIEALN